MFRITRRPATESVRFCDDCARVSTAAQRTQRRYEQTRTEVLVAHIGLH